VDFVEGNFWDVLRRQRKKLKQVQNPEINRTYTAVQLIIVVHHQVRIQAKASQSKSDAYERSERRQTSAARNSSCKCSLKPLAARAGLNIGFALRVLALDTVT
jgi:hypothetical protein